MSLHSRVIRHTFAPAMDLVRGTHTMRHLRELEQSQWWPAERIEELQSEKLRRLIRHAYENVPYYRKVMDERGINPLDIRSAADLSRMPVLTREMARLNAADLVSRVPVRTPVWKASTGGSTGTPLSFYTTSEDQREHGFARGIRALEYAGVRLGDGRMLIRRARHKEGLKEKTLHQMSRRIERVIELDGRDITLNTLPAIVAILRRPGLICLTGYPTAVAYIAAWIHQAGVTPPALDSVITGGEQLFEHQRQWMRDAFGREPHSKYSCQEVFEIAMECEAHTGLHVAAEDVVVEVAGTGDHPLPPGEEGRLLLTNLHNYVMPFIRYENGDSGSFVPGRCPCGRSLPLLSHVVGRRFDTVYTPSGRRITGSNLGSSRLAQFPVLQFQFVQEELDRLVVRVVPHPGTGAQDREQMVKRIPPMLTETIGSDVRVEVELCDEIPLTSGGKHLLVISKVDPDSWLRRSES